MDLFKTITKEDKVYVLMLTYNSHVWCERQWAYYYVVKNNYPSDNLKNATNFETIENAQAWINERVK